MEPDFDHWGYAFLRGANGFLQSVTSCNKCGRRHCNCYKCRRCNAKLVLWTSRCKICDYKTAGNPHDRGVA